MRDGNIGVFGKNGAAIAVMAALAIALPILIAYYVPLAHAQPTSSLYGASGINHSNQLFIVRAGHYCGYTCGYNGTCPVGPVGEIGSCKIGSNGCYSCVYSPTGTVTKTSTSSTTTITTAQSCLVGAPGNYCGYSACPSGYSCMQGSSPEGILKQNGICNIAFRGGYAFGTCQPTQSSPGQVTPPASGSCGYLPPYLANVITANEKWYCPINYYTYSEWAKYLPLAIVAVLLAFVIAAMIIMIGIATKSEGLRNFGMGEFLEAAASAITVLVFLYISAVMFGLFPGSLVGPINPYATAFHLINSTIISTQTIYSTIFNVYAPAAFYLSMSTTTNYGVGAAATNFVSAKVGTLLKIAKNTIYSPFAGAIDLFLIEPSLILTSMLTDAAALLYAEYFLIAFFAMAAIPAFLVPGVIFRALLPTRALGGVLIAMAMGFYLVVPTMFALAYYFTTPQLAAQLSILSATMNQFGSGTGSQVNSLTPTSPLSTALVNVQSAMGGYWLLILFYPSLIISVTYLFIVQVSKIIGGQSYGIGRARGFI